MKINLNVEVMALELGKFRFQRYVRIKNQLIEYGLWKNPVCDKKLPSCFGHWHDIANGNHYPWQREPVKCSDCAITEYAGRGKRFKDESDILQNWCIDMSYRRIIQDYEHHFACEFPKLKFNPGVLCACGCGKPVNTGRNYLKGHYWKHRHQDARRTY